MHIVLTDLLACPFCGEAHGLIVRADRIAERHVLEGALGCPDCRRLFPIRNGVAHFPDADASAPGPGPDPAAADGDEPIRIAALLGLDRARGFVLLTGPAARHAGAVARLAEGVEIVAANIDGGTQAPDPVSRIRIGGTLPFGPAMLRGIWLAGPYADSLLAAAARALHPTGRLVLEPAPDDAESRLPPGFRVIARRDRTLVCARNV